MEAAFSDPATLPAMTAAQSENSCEGEVLGTSSSFRLRGFRHRVKTELRRRHRLSCGEGLVASLRSEVPRPETESES